MLFQDVTPDTVLYMIAGYAVFFIVSASYVLSLFLRHRAPMSWAKTSSEGLMCFGLR